MPGVDQTASKSGSDRQWRWLAVCLAWMVAVVVADVLLAHGAERPVLLVGLLSGGPMLASLKSTPRHTAAVSLCGTVVAIALVASSGMPVDVDLAGRSAVFVWACGFSVWAAQRRSEAQALSEERRLAAARAEFMAEATTLLVGSLDYDQTLANVARAAVPTLADWCAVDLLEDGAIRRVAVAHADCEKERFGWELSARYPPQLSDERGVGQVIRSCAGHLMPVIDDELLRARARDPEHLRISRQLGLRSAMAVPILWQDKAIGAITFATSHGSRAFTEDDFTLAIDLAARSARAIEHARVHRERDHIARTLQASLLPPALPDAPGLKLAARYRPAGADADVGGDFYDCFALGDGEWIAVIGDVEGKGVEAATLTNLVHHTLRTVSMQESSPARMLERLNEIVVRRHGECGGRFCTVAVVTLRPQPDGSISATVALGGHGFPLVRRADATVEAVGTPGTLIGAVPEITVCDHEFALAPGDAMLLFSDGVSEARRDGRLLGEAGVAALLAGCDAGDPEAVCADVERGVLDHRDNERCDDVALLCVRGA